MGAWFRARLDRDPRRWVLVIAAGEGLAAFALNLQEKRDSFFGQGMGVAVLLVATIFLPSAGVLGMLAHGRLLLWTGKLLGGRAAAHEIHAAFAWSQVPFVVTAAPLVLELPLRGAAAAASPVPPSLAAALHGLATASEPLGLLAAVAAVVGGALYVKFLAEAQGFSTWRALANHLLAALLGAALLFGSVFASVRLQPGAAPYRVVPLALVLMALPPLVVERLVARGRRRPAPSRAT